MLPKEQITKQRYQKHNLLGGCNNTYHCCYTNRYENDDDINIKNIIITF